jgi:hypothetical protein
MGDRRKRGYDQRVTSARSSRSAEASSPLGELSLDRLVESFTREELVEVVLDAAERHDDVARTVRLAIARKQGDLGALRAEVDGALRTRRFLDYWKGMEWAQAARPVVAELERAVRTAPSRDLVELLQRAIGHVVKVIHRADDSSGLIGELVRDLLDLHARACDPAVADPVKLAAWMIRFRFADQDYFDVDPVRYAGALGEQGMAAYRSAIEQIEDAGAYGLQYVHERLAVLDRDIDAIVRLHGADLTNPFQFLHVAEAMAELGRHDLVIEWTSRGIAETNGWQLYRLYDLACDTHAQLGQPLEVLRLRRSHHTRMPSSSTYEALRNAAEEVDAWEIERPAARSVLREADTRGFIDALLGDGDRDLAWDVAIAAPPDALDAEQWLRLAESREPEHPGDALAVYQAVVDEVLQTADRRAYRDGVRILKKAAKAARAADQGETFSKQVARLREQHRRRPTLIAMLDKAGFV